MQRLKSNQPTYFDVDDTLIMWSPTPEQLEAYGVEFDHTYEDGTRRIGKILPHRVHIRQLIKHAMRGHTIIVWSAGGEPWAYAAVKALGIEQYVDYTIQKPIWAYDDKKPNEFFDTKFYKDEEGGDL